MGNRAATEARNSEEVLYRPGPVCKCSNPLQVGAGDQGQWNSCAVFATLTTLNTVLRLSYKLELDVQRNAEGLLMRNLRNSQGGLIQDEGTEIPWLISLLASENISYWTKDRRRLTFKPVIRSRQSHQEFLAEARRQIHRCGHTYSQSFKVIAAGGTNGNHSSHALAVKEWRANDDLSLTCENSWGESNKYPVVPGPMWPRILALFTLSVEQVMVQDRAGAPMKEISAQWFGMDNFWWIESSSRGKGRFRRKPARSLWHGHYGIYVPDSDSDIAEW